MTGHTLVLSTQHIWVMITNMVSDTWLDTLVLSTQHMWVMITNTLPTYAEWRVPVCVQSRVTDHVSNHYPHVLSGEYRSVFSHVSLTMLVNITHMWQVECSVITNMVSDMTGHTLVLSTQHMWVMITNMVSDTWLDTLVLSTQHMWVLITNMVSDNTLR
jgi:uncharacterized membrane protein